MSDQIHFENATASVDARWSAWHLYPQAMYDVVIDDLIEEVIAPVVDTLKQPNFFIRYWYLGSHVRLRIRDLTMAEKLSTEERLVYLLDRFNMVHPDPCISHDDYVAWASAAAKAGENGRSMDVGHLRHPGCYAEIYRPEFDRYGGEAMMPLSEDVFCSSSRAVLDFLRARPNLSKRKILAVLLLDMAVELLHETDRRIFLERGRSSWQDWIASSGLHYDFEYIHSVADDVLQKLERSGIRLGRSVRPPHFDVFFVQLNMLIANLDKDAGSLLGSHLHMTFNRLGLSIFDELLVYTIVSDFYLS